MHFWVKEPFLYRISLVVAEETIFPVNIWYVIKIPVSLTVLPQLFHGIFLPFYVVAFCTSVI